MYKTHTLEEYNEAINLRNKFGWGATKIFSFLSRNGRCISKGAISDWIYTNKKPFQDKVLSKILPQFKFLIAEKAYILGVLCGDGYIRITQPGQYLVGLDVCDEDFADEFRSCLKKVYGLLPSKVKSCRRVTNFTDNAKLRYRINLTSKLVVQDLLKYSKSFKTKEWTVPEEVLKSGLEVKSSFLRGLFDSDGGVSLKKPYGVRLSVCSCSVNKSSLLEIKKMLKKDFDIDLTINYDKSVIKLRSSGYKNVKNYCDKINFTIKRKRDRLRIGLSTYCRKGVRRYSLEFKKRALELLDKYKDPYFVAELLGINNANIYGWKNGRYITGLKNLNKK